MDTQTQAARVGLKESACAIDGENKEGGGRNDATQTHTISQTYRNYIYKYNNNNGAQNILKSSFLLDI